MFAVLALSLIEMQILMSVKQTRQALICTIFVSFRFVVRRIMRRKVCHKMQHRQAGSRHQLPQQLQLNWESSRCLPPLCLCHACHASLPSAGRQIADWQPGSLTEWRPVGLPDCLTGCLAAWRLNACREQTQQNFKFIQINSLSSQSVGVAHSTLCVCVCTPSNEQLNEWFN